MQSRHKLLQFFCFFMGLLLLLPTVPASAQEPEPPSLEEADAAYLSHLESGIVIASKNEAVQLAAGSTPKVMAGLLACEALADRLEESVVITSDMLLTVKDDRRFGIEKGDEYTIQQLLYIALCGSYNDAYDVLACVIAGSLKDYVLQMNDRAKKLGLTNTYFSDASGIDDNSTTTAEEMAAIAMAAYENELYIKITSTTRYQSPATLLTDVKTISNRNALIYSTQTTAYHNDKCRGMNAGNTPRAGSCVVTAATNGTDTYVCVVMGGEQADGKDFGYVLTNRLVNWVYNAYTHMEVLSPDTLICTLPVSVSDLTSEVEVRTKDTLTCYLPVGLTVGENLTFSVRLLYNTLEAPVEEGRMVGYVAVMYQGKTVGTLPIYTAQAAQRSSFISSLKSIQALFQNRAFCAGAIFFAVTLIAWIVTEYVLLKRRRHKWDKYFSMKMNPSPTAIPPKRRPQKR
ncbi:MAG: D-alanyl-D-alanine carboxypeptidase [Clostridia bacterium]|nr:D-alanyl-D-alanine carboxypeptidase [Clostridia bacterium]